MVHFTLSICMGRYVNAIKGRGGPRVLVEMFKGLGFRAASRIWANSRFQCKIARNWLGCRFFGHSASCIPLSQFAVARCANAIGGRDGAGKLAEVFKT